MTLFFYLILISAGVASGCAPGTGSLGTRGSFEFEMIPPIVYTYSSDLSHGQISSTFAVNLVKSDVQNSINEVLQANSIPLNDVSPPVITFTAPEITLVDTCATANEGVIFDEKVYYECTSTLSKSVFSVPLTVQITAVTAIYESQWAALAEQVQEKLTTKRNAAFVTDPIITVT